jgi:hypothetical protein
MEFISKYLMYNFHLVCNIQLQIVDNANGWNEIGNRRYFDEMVGNAVHHDEFG